MLKVYTISEVSKIVGKTPQAVRAWCSKQGIERDGRKYLITREVLSSICAYYKIDLEKLSESDSESSSDFESSSESQDATALLIQVLREQLEIKDKQLEAKDKQIEELEATNASLAENVKNLIDSNKALSASTAMATAADKKEILTTVGSIEKGNKQELSRWQRLKLAWKGKDWN